MIDGAGGILQRDALIGLKAYWRQKRFDWNAGTGNLDYIGFHAESDALTSGDNWTVWKLTYTGSDLTLIEGPITGIWDNRATLDWL
jgi:hypothetical protein